LDTWFSSGLWTFSTLGWPEKTVDLQTFHPTSVLETGYDILFFWVARMVLMTTYTLGDIPFEKVYMHGLVRDENTYSLLAECGIRTISDEISADKLLPEAQAERVEIARRRPDLSVEIIPVNLKKAWGGDQDQDVLLRALDEVAVRTELKAARVVALNGQIVRPGRYVIAEGERLSAVLERAGGRARTHRGRRRGLDARARARAARGPRTRR